MTTCFESSIFSGERVLGLLCWQVYLLLWPALARFLRLWQGVWGLRCLNDCYDCITDGRQIGYDLAFYGVGNWAVFLACWFSWFV